MLVLYTILGSIRSWLDGFNSAALGVSVLIGEYYIFSKGYRFIKRRVERMASDRGADCWVILQRTQSIVFKNPEKVTRKQKAHVQYILFLHIVALILTSILWLGLMVGLGMLLHGS